MYETVLVGSCLNGTVDEQLGEEFSSFSVLKPIVRVIGGLKGTQLLANYSVQYV